MRKLALVLAAGFGLMCGLQAFAAAADAPAEQAAPAKKKKKAKRMKKAVAQQVLYKCVVCGTTQDKPGEHCGKPCEKVQ